MDKNSDELNRAIFVGLALQTGLSQMQLSKWTQATNSNTVDRELYRKLVSPDSKSFRRWTKADLLFFQTLNLLNVAGFDLSSVKFNENKLISDINHPELGRFSFETLNLSPIEFDKECVRKPSEYFECSEADKLEFISKAKLIQK
ncbi:hypothetical protein OCF84_20515 (plasmid) [Shewanella xiamenensis]|uniref:Uncharacterized protein n=1 Tax=Shewanella xiamenensis TaxID=332186 RepID=A0ABT6UFH5_9GAMM|nr:hypothetical protein [Shewanella xiamenensis]MDI5832480.1 hypothetical protein [Shewanella xiamenensis]WHF57901.1 hypothetical protein OCF84_20515 [Shewanella xiamenensis]